VRKLGAPGNPEYAIGSVDESGFVQINKEAGFSEDDPYVKEETARQLETIRSRRKSYTPQREPIDLANRTVIVVDDGIATGSTMLAALKAIKSQKPAKLVVAVGVAPAEAIKRIQKEVDEVVCPKIPKLFFAVGQFYSEFAQVSDEEVITLLK
jgi:predicted phosphoribosyltransferase